MSRSPFGTLDSPGNGWVPFHNSILESVRWIARALWTEVFGFRFGYPIELAPEAGPRHSLHYYVSSERLFFDVMHLDEDGVPVQRSRMLGAFYNPAYVAWYGLMALEQSLRKGEKCDKRFQIQVDWLLNNAVRCNDGSAVWPFPVDVKEGQCFLKAPWVSAMSQGLALSVLVRAHRVGIGGDSILELGRAALRVFCQKVEEGGIRTVEEGRVFYGEYPGYPLPRVLDGFLFSLLGLYDLWVETGDSGVGRLFSDGIEGLRRCLSFWDYRGKWSWYGRRVYLCPPHYHALNTQLLSVLGCLTEDPVLSEQASRWAPRNLSWADRIEIYTLFVTTKNWTRLRLPNEKGG